MQKTIFLVVGCFISLFAVQASELETININHKSIEDYEQMMQEISRLRDKMKEVVRNFDKKYPNYKLINSANWKEEEPLFISSLSSVPKKLSHFLCSNCISSSKYKISRFSS